MSSIDSCLFELKIHLNLFLGLLIDISFNFPFIDRVIFFLINNSRSLLHEGNNIDRISLSRFRSIDLISNKMKQPLHWNSRL